MKYTEPIFSVFSALTFAIYYNLRSARRQVGVLVLASLFFYAWQAPAILAVFLCSWLAIGGTSYGVLVLRDRHRAKLLATIGVAVNPSLLAFFKYTFLVVPASAAGTGAADLYEFLDAVHLFPVLT